MVGEQRRGRVCTCQEAAVLDLHEIYERLLGIEMEYGAKSVDPQLNLRLN